MKSQRPVRTQQQPRRRQSAGFTLIELLVVVTIVLLVSAVTLPVIVPALNNRQVGESARILQAALSGARDAAIRADAPRGIRLLPDPLLNRNAVYDTATGALLQPGVLTFSRMIPIEPGPEYSQGTGQITPDITRVGASTFYASTYPVPLPDGSFSTYPNGFDSNNSLYDKGKVLRFEECAFRNVGGVVVPNPPTSWWWNIRVGDKLRLGDSGQYYTVVGPLTINPTTSGGQNPELFVNDGLPNNVRTTSGLQTDYGSGLVGIEFLYLVNGQDDNKNGLIDEGWDGINNDLANGIDDVFQNTTTLNYGEWEVETWLSSASKYNTAASTTPLKYTISRRPVPSPSAREIALPGATVIDATTWNSTAERSRLPVDPNSKTVDIMVNQSGEIVSTYTYSTPASTGITGAFYHFWISDRSDVTDPETGLVFPSLPLVEGSANYTGTNFLKKDRMLLTLFTRSGMIVTNSIETFDAHDEDLPYRGPQLGTREDK